METKEVIENLNKELRIHEWCNTLNGFKLQNLDLIMLQYEMELKNTILREEQEVENIKSQIELLKNFKKKGE